MKSLLDALKEGRLIELPDTDKDKSLEYLAVLIEAIPHITFDIDFVKEIKEREKQANTGIGMGVACPHARSKLEGALYCAVGWSPSGIDYGAYDGKKVHLIVLYYIPDSHKNTYLKEISSLAKAITETNGIQDLEKIQDMNSFRAKLLDWVEMSLDKALPDAKARMIKLEEKQLAAEKVQQVPGKAERFLIIPFSVVMIDPAKLFILSQNPELVNRFDEKTSELQKLLSTRTDFDFEGYQVVISSSRSFEQKRAVYDCVAIKIKNPA
jgi:nitrogen PTS system EIIA component